MELRTPLPEALDRLSILSLKLEHVTDEQKKSVVKREYDYYVHVVESYRLSGLVVKDEWLKGLIDVNRRCWDMEDAIREGQEGRLGLEEVGRRALELRNMNKERIALKQHIAQETGMDFFEIKVNHASA
jgi:hypothetical protein